MSEMSASEKKKEDWMNSKWRPMMGWMYMLVCTMDFVVFPILWSVIQAMADGKVEAQWDPITLRGAGLFHMAMGAVLGVTAWSRGQEKLAGANNGGLQQISTSGSNSSGVFQSGSANNVITATSGGSFGSIPNPTTASGKPKVPVGNEPEL